MVSRRPCPFPFHFPHQHHRHAHAIPDTSFVPCPAIATPRHAAPRYHTTPHHTTPHRITSHIITSHHATLHPTTLHSTTTRYATPRHITPRHDWMNSWTLVIASIRVASCGPHVSPAVWGYVVSRSSFSSVDMFGWMFEKRLFVVWRMFF